ncbi:MAG: GNAT family N-acetyltransferase, partial [Rhodoferax sp.]
MSAAHTALRICRADYGNSAHARALVYALDAYARDPMGGSQPLSQFARDHLVQSLAALPQAFSVLAFYGSDENNLDQVAGLVNCLEGFSTFACRPLVNVHDLAVLPTYRGRGVGAGMLALVEQLALERGACKLTLEVLQGNAAAMRL